MTTILIAEDNVQERQVLETLLKMNNFDVIAAKDGVEALDKAKKSPPDLVLSDALMPVMDGFELCRLWHLNDQLKRVPFVFYTSSYTESKDEELALKLGAEQFIIKPQKS